MWEVFKLFDAYTIRARILPALIAGLPSLALPFTVIPWSHLGLSNAIMTTTSFVLLYAFAGVARRGGYRVERKLQTRSTPELWHRSNKEIPNVTKDRFRAFIATKIKHEAPTEYMEINEPAKTNDFYNSASVWLRESTRDKKRFNILFDELIMYGFRRNLQGLKYISLVANFLVASICVAILFFPLAYFSKVSSMDEKMVSVLVVVALHSLYMIFAVRENSVRDASRAYGKQLILSCNMLMSPTARSPKNTAKD